MNDIRDIQQTNVFINELTGSSYFSSEIFRKIYVRCGILFCIFNIAIAIFVFFTNTNQAYEVLVGFNILLSIECATFLDFCISRFFPQQTI
jgi:uncharacterized protein YqhQ